VSNAYASIQHKAVGRSPAMEYICIGKINIGKHSIERRFMNYKCQCDICKPGNGTNLIPGDPAQNILSCLKCLCQYRLVEEKLEYVKKIDHKVTEISDHYKQD
jgi:hypothetical protein